MPAVLNEHYTGGASNSNPDASLGGVSSSVQVSGVALNNIYDDVTPDEALSGKSEYRAIDIVNSGDENAVTVTMHMSVPTSSADTQLDFGLEASPIGSTTAIGNEDTPPAGVSFANYTPGSKLSLPDIPNGNYCRLWLRRVVSPGATNTSNDEGTIRTEYA